MKKALLVCAGLFSATALMAQQSAQEADGVAEQVRPVQGTIAHSADRATPFWTEDFGNGWPAGWAAIDTSGICPWVYSTDGTYGFFNGNSGTAAGDAIMSTTASNGFLICDNDSANNANFGQPSGSTYQYLSSYVGTSSIDCSGHPSVILSFEQFFRYNNGVSMWVQASNDSINWTSYEVSGNAANNTASVNPELKTVNLSPVAANQANVYLRWGWSARVYYWMIDDISLSEADPNDVATNTGWWGAGNYDYQHYMIPLTQASPITFRAELSNNDGVVLNDIYADVEVTDGGGTSVYSGVTNMMNLNPTEFDTFSTTTTWTPSATGDYDVNYDADLSGATDGNLNNNNVLDNIYITSSVYGMDNLADLSLSTADISNFSSNTGMAFSIGNVYEIMADDDIECVEIGIADDVDNVDQLIYGQIFYNDNGTWSFLDQTNDYEIDTSDRGEIVTIPFGGPVAVTAGMEILVLAGHYGGTDVAFMQGQQVPDRSVYGFDAGGTAFWLSSPRAIVCRANFSCGVGFDEQVSQASVTAYPNPFQGQLTVAMDLPQAAQVQGELIDITGKTVQLINTRNYSAGSHQLQVDGQGLSAGTYTLSLRIGEQIVHQQVVVH